MIEPQGSQSADERGYSAYYVRYGERFVSWFCTPEDAELFLESGVENNHFAAIGSTPEPGLEYEDLGHENCWDNRHWAPSAEELAVLSVLNDRTTPTPPHLVFEWIEVPSDLLETLHRWHARLYRAVAVLLDRQLIEQPRIAVSEIAHWLVITDAGREALAATAAPPRIVEKDRP